MPDLHQVPMFFSSWICGRRANLTETIDELDDDVDLLSYVDKAEVISVTEEDDDDDESLDDFLNTCKRLQQQPPVEIAPSTTSTSSTASPRRLWDSDVNKSRYTRYESNCSTDEDEDEGASLCFSSPLEPMIVIPFVSLNFNYSKDAAESTTSGDDDEVQQQKEEGEEALHWKTTLAAAAGDTTSEEQPEQASSSLVPAATTAATTAAATTAAAVTTTTSPSCSRRSKTKALSPSFSSLRGRVQLPITATLAPPPSIWPSIPYEIVITTNSNSSSETEENGEELIWDPARPLIWDHDWDAHALDVNSAFADACRQFQSLLQKNGGDDNDDEILRLMEQYPELCLVRYKLGHYMQYPLHWCCHRGWLRGMEQCYQTIPEVIGCALDSMLPLHVATQQACSLEVVELLCHRYPTALKHTNAQHRTPLHLAVLSQADEAVIECVLRLYPTAAQLADVHGWTPTHYVCQNGSANVLRLLLLQDPSVAVTVTRNLEKPLHIAAQCNAGDLIRVLLETKYSNDLETAATSSIQTACGRASTTTTTTATTSAVMISSSSSSTSSLRPRTGSAPRTTSAASYTDSKFFTPLHYLTTHGSWMDAAVLKLLVEACPSAKYITNEDDCTPYELAVKAHASQDLLALLR